MARRHPVGAPEAEAGSAGSRRDLVVSISRPIRRAGRRVVAGVTCAAPGSLPRRATAFHTQALDPWRGPNTSARRGSAALGRVPTHRRWNVDCARVSGARSRRPQARAAPTSTAMREATPARAPPDSSTRPQRPAVCRRGRTAQTVDSPVEARAQKAIAAEHTAAVTALCSGEGPEPRHDDGGAASTLIRTAVPRPRARCRAWIA
jgi:hypothetical protein